MNALGFPSYDLGSLITFNSGTPDAFGSYWYMDGEMAGWDSPDSRSTMLTKIGLGPSADGEIAADVHYRGRTLSWKMYAACTSETNRENSRLLLAQAVDLIGSTGTLTVNEAVPKFVTVEHAGNANQGKLLMVDRGFSTFPIITPGLSMPDVDSNGLVYVLEANVELYCPDPRKYAVTPVVTPFASFTVGMVTFWGIPALTNPGNTRTSKITVAVTGPGAGNLNFEQTGFGGALSGLILAVPTTPGPALPGFPGQLNIDVLNQTIEDGSGNNYYYLRQLLSAPPWPYLWPGINYITGTGGLDGAAATLTYYPAWI